jgi:hypothetical protein
VTKTRKGEDEIDCAGMFHLSGREPQLNLSGGDPQLKIPGVDPGQITRILKEDHFVLTQEKTIHVASVKDNQQKYPKLQDSFI